jgi:RNA polymerase sigma-70 factor (ECF subfamily)
MALENEQLVIRRCQRGEIAAFRELYVRYEEPMLRLAFRLLGNREDAEDALQVAFTKAFRGIGRFRGDARFSTWLYRIVANACYDRLKRKPRKETTLDEMPERVSGDKPDLRFHLREAIDALPTRMQACFVLHVQEGFKYREVADMLQMKEGTVKRHVFDARERLRAVLTPPVQGGSR